MRTLLLSRDKILLIAKFGTILQEIIVFQVTKNDITSGGIFYIMFFNIFCADKLPKVHQIYGDEFHPPHKACQVCKFFQMHPNY